MPREPFYPHWTVDTCLSHGGCYYDAEAGGRAVRFIEGQFRHTKGRWRGQLLVLEEWQREIVRMLFGVKDSATRKRRFKKVSGWLPRKMAKSTLFAAIATYHLGWDGEQGGEVVMGASTREQANLLFDLIHFNATEPGSVIERKCEAYARSVVHKDSGSTAKVVSSEAGTVHGLNPSFGFVDELHVHPNDKLYEAIKTGQGSRDQPLFVTISTAGVVGSFAHGEFQYAERVLRGEASQPDLLPIIYGADPGADPFDPATWAEAMPNLGVSVERGFIEAEATEARQKPSAYNSFLNLYLNIWVSSSEAWMQPHAWQAARRDLPGWGAHEGRPECYVGFDLSVKKDLTAVSLIVVPEDGPPEVYTRGYVPSDELPDKRKNELSDIDAYVASGHVVAIPGEVIDLEYVRRDLLALADVYDVKCVSYDPYGAQAFAESLVSDGFEVMRVSAAKTVMSEPTKAYEAALLSGDLVHEGNGLMTWFMGNVVLERDAMGLVRPSKKASRNKIDGAVSAVIAYAGYHAASYAAKEAPTYFERHGEVFTL